MVRSDSATVREIPTAVGHLALHVELFLTLCGSVGFGVLLEEVEGRRFFGGELSGFRNFLDRSGNGHSRQQLNAAVVLKTRTGGDKTAQGDVFLQAPQGVHTARGGRLGKEAGGLRGAGGGEKRDRPKRRLWDAQEKGGTR